MSDGPVARSGSKEPGAQATGPYESPKTARRTKARTAPRSRFGLFPTVQQHPAFAGFRAAMSRLVMQSSARTPSGSSPSSLR